MALVLGGAKKTKGSENSSRCHVGWEAPISWSWAPLPCPPVCNTLSGHMVSWCLLLAGGFVWRMLLHCLTAPSVMKTQLGKYQFIC